MVTLTPEIRDRVQTRLGINLATDKGVLLIDVVSRSPAATAGLKAGDIIQSISSQPVNKIEDVQKLVESSKIGIPLQLQVQRNGQVVQIAVSPAAFPVQKPS